MDDDMDNLFGDMGDDFLAMLRNAQRTDKDEENSPAQLVTTEISFSSSSFDNGTEREAGGSKIRNGDDQPTVTTVDSSMENTKDTTTHNSSVSSTTTTLNHTPTEAESRDAVVRHILTCNNDIERTLQSLDRSINDVFTGLPSTVTASFTSSSTKTWTRIDTARYSYTIHNPSVTLPDPELLPSLLNYYGLLRIIQERSNKLRSSLPKYNKYDITNDNLRYMRVKLVPLFKLGFPPEPIEGQNDEHPAHTGKAAPSSPPVNLRSLATLLAEQLQNDSTVDISGTIAELFILTDYLQPHLDTYRSNHGTDRLNTLLEILVNHRTVRQILMFYMAEMLYATGKPSKITVSSIDDTDYLSFTQTRPELLRITTLNEIERNKLDRERIQKIFQFVNNDTLSPQLTKLWFESMDYFFQKIIKDQQTEEQKSSSTSTSSTTLSFSSSSVAESSKSNKTGTAGLEKFMYTKTDTGSTSSEWITTNPSSDLANRSSFASSLYDRERTFRRSIRRKEWISPGNRSVMTLSPVHGSFQRWLVVCRLAQFLLSPLLPDAVIRSTLLILKDNEVFEQQVVLSRQALTNAVSADAFTFTTDDHASSAIPSSTESSLPPSYGDHLSRLKITMEQEEEQYRRKHVHNAFSSTSSLSSSSSLNPFLPLSEKMYTRAVSILGEILYDILDPYNPFLFLLLSDATILTKNNTPYVTPGPIKVWNIAQALADTRLLTVLNFIACWYYPWLMYPERCPYENTTEPKLQDPDEISKERYGLATDVVRRVYDTNTVHALEAVGKPYHDRWILYLLWTMDPVLWPYYLDKDEVDNAPYAERNRCVIFSQHSWWTGSRCMILIPPSDPNEAKIFPYVTVEDEETITKSDDDEESLPVHPPAGGGLASLVTRNKHKQRVIEDSEDDHPSSVSDAPIDQEEAALPDAPFQRLLKISTFPEKNNAAPFRNPNFDIRFPALYLPANYLTEIRRVPEARPTTDIVRSNYTEAMRKLGIEVRLDRDAPYYANLKTFETIKRIMAWDMEWMKRNILIYAGEPTNNALFGIFCFTLTDLQIQEIQRTRSQQNDRGPSLSLRDTLHQHSSLIDLSSPRSSVSGGLSSGLTSNGSNTLNLVSQSSVSTDNVLLDINTITGWPTSLTPGRVMLPGTSKSKSSSSSAVITDLARYYADHPNESALPGPIILEPGNLVRLATAAGHVHDRPENDHWIIAIRSNKASRVTVEALVRRENTVVRTTLSPEIDALYFPGMKVAVPLGRTKDHQWYFTEGVSTEAEKYQVHAETVANNFHRSLSRRNSIEWIRNGGSIMQLTGIPEGLRFQQMHRYAVYYVMEREFLERLDSHGLLGTDTANSNHKPSALPSVDLLKEDLRALRESMKVPRLEDYYIRGWSSVESNALSSSGSSSSFSSMDDDTFDPPTLRKILQPLMEQLPTASSSSSFFASYHRERPLPMEWTPEANKIHRNEMDYLVNLQTWLSKNNVSSAITIPQITDMSVWLQDDSFPSSSFSSDSNPNHDENAKPGTKRSKSSSSSSSSFSKGAVTSPIDMTLSPDSSVRNASKDSRSKRSRSRSVEFDTLHHDAASTTLIATTGKNTKRNRSPSFTLNTVPETDNEPNTSITSTIATGKRTGTKDSRSSSIASSKGTATPSRRKTSVSSTISSPESPDTGNFSSYLPSNTKR